MDSTDFAFIFYVVIFIAIFFISYFYAILLAKKTGQLGVHAVIAFTMNLLLGIATITGWCIYAWGNGFLFIGGLILGGAVLLISEIVLIIILFAKRKRYSD